MVSMSTAKQAAVCMCSTNISEISETGGSLETIDFEVGI
jgi:hypothetical protein